MFLMSNTNMYRKILKNNPYKYNRKKAISILMLLFKVKIIVPTASSSNTKEMESFNNFLLSKLGSYLYCDSSNNCKSYPHF